MFAFGVFTVWCRGTRVLFVSREESGKRKAPRLRGAFELEEEGDYQESVMPAHQTFQPLALVV